VVDGSGDHRPVVTVALRAATTWSATTLNSTDEWGLTGVWSVTLETDGIAPGTYTIEADDGDNPTPSRWKSSTAETRRTGTPLTPAAFSRRTWR
jgi:hypothetical protein